MSKIQLKFTEAQWEITNENNLKEFITQVQGPAEVATFFK